MGARVIHFGPDDCHRLMVLRSAGYSIHDCRSLIQLRDCLAGGAAAEALLMSDGAESPPWEAVQLVRVFASLPVILFRTTNLSYEESGVDLVVHSLTPPEVWLKEVDSLIEKDRKVRAASGAQAGTAAELRREPTFAVVKPGEDRDGLWEESARPPATERFAGAEKIRPKTARQIR